MKYLVGTAVDGTAVFAVEGDKAVNLTALNAAIGHDLIGLITSPELIESVAGQMADAPRVDVASITPPCRSRNPARSFALA